MSAQRAVPLSTDLLTPEDVALEMKVSRSQVYALIASGDLRTVNVSAGSRRPRLRITRAALAEFYAARAI